MSYDIYFIKRNDLSSNNIEAILESDVTTSDIHFVSKEKMLEIKDQLAGLGLIFEVFDKSGKDYLELNFPTYQVSMFNSQFAISVPYWDANSSEGINHEIKLIVNAFLDNGFTGYDQQTDEFIVTKYEFKKTFTESKTVVEKGLNNKSASNFNLITISIGLAVIIVIFVIWKLLK